VNTGGVVEANGALVAWIDYDIAELTSEAWVAFTGNWLATNAAKAFALVTNFTAWFRSAVVHSCLHIFYSKIHYFLILFFRSYKILTSH